MNYFNEDVNKAVFQNEETEVTANIKEEKKVFGVWNVGGSGYQLKLNTAGVKELESRYKVNLLSMTAPREGESAPPLTAMLDVVQVAMKPWNHGIKVKDVELLYDKYIEEGGDLMAFYMDVYMEVFLVSGFFSKAVAQEMVESLKEMKRNM